MSNEMPIRDDNAGQATWSDRAFQSRLPNLWTVHPIAEDYGIDRRVEIFEENRATGLFFNVQLKSKRTGSGERPYDSIRRTTLNYWESMSDPTLIVIAHEPSDRVWYEWAHLLPHEDDPRTKSRQVRCDREWDTSSADELQEEVRAFRSSRDLATHAPVPVVVMGDSFYGQSSTQLKIALKRKLIPLRSFVYDVGSTNELPRFEVKFEDQRALVRVAGTRWRELTWDLRGDRPYDQIASELVAALGMAAAAVGAEMIAVRLLKACAAESQMLLSAQGLPYVVALLTRNEEYSTVMTLMRRTIFVENHPAGMLPLAAVHDGGADAALLKAIASGLRDSARLWARPALGIYNAASILKDADPSAAVELYAEAAKHDPRYLERGYWWREKGESLWNSGDPEAALDCYREAMRLGDQAAQAYSADVLMRTGRYREAREAFAQAPIFENARDAQWRLSLRALNFIIDELGIPDQSRTPDQKPTFEPQHLETMKEDALAALQNDALDGSAHYALSMALAAEGVPQIGASIAAAVTVIVNPVGWLNLFSQAMKNGSLSDADRLTIAFDSMICAWKYFGPDFGEEILSDESMTEELRGEVLALFESVKPDAAPFEIRFHEEDGKFQSVMVPMR